jgi:hypothetical protein
MSQETNTGLVWFIFSSQFKTSSTFWNFIPNHISFFHFSFQKIYIYSRHVTPLRFAYLRKLGIWFLLYSKKNTKKVYAIRKTMIQRNVWIQQFWNFIQFFNISKTVSEFCPKRGTLKPLYNVPFNNKIPAIKNLISSPSVVNSIVRSPMNNEIPI